MFGKISFLKKVIIELVLLIIAAVWMFPIVQMVVKSFTMEGFGNYITVLTKAPVSVPISTLNSLIIAVTVSVLVFAVVSLAAYAFAKMEFKLKNLFYYMLLACLAVPPAAICTPLFSTIKSFGLINTLGAVIFPVLAFQAPFALLILRNYFDTIPNDIIEAARIDGAGSFKILYMIMMPLAKPGFVNVMILTFINAWNEYLIPLLVLNKPARYTVTLAVTQFSGSVHQTPAMVGQLYAALVMMAIPTISIYVYGQRYIQDGLTAGAVKS